MAKKISNKLSRDVARAFQVVAPTSLVWLAREFVQQSQEGAAVLREHYRERRKCIETTAAGEPCKAWALWDCREQLCASHFYKRRGPVLSHEERTARDNQRNRPTCNCEAYPFPHRPNNGLCCWPEDPIETHPLPAGKRALGKMRRRKVSVIRKKFGI